MMTPRPYLEIYLDQLAGTHHFTLEQLAENRAGRLHPVQLAKRRSSGFGAGIGCLVFAVLVLIGSVGGALALYDDFRKPISPTDMNGIYLLSTLLAIRGQVDRQGDLGLENAVAELLEDGEVLRHSLRARRAFHARRDLLVELLREKLGDVLTFEVPRGGLALWARVDERLDVEAWAKATLQRGARFFTGRQYMPSGAAIPYVRLGFGHLDEPELTEAVKCMAAALPHSSVRRSSSSAKKVSAPVKPQPR